MAVAFVILRNLFPQMPGRAAKAKTRVQDETVDRIVAKARANAKRDTGNMANSTVNAGGGLAHAQAPYSGFLDQGTRYIPPDRWFTGPALEEGATLASTAGDIFKAELGG